MSSESNNIKIKNIINEYNNLNSTQKIVFESFCKFVHTNGYINIPLEILNAIKIIVPYQLHDLGIDNIREQTSNFSDQVDNYMKNVSKFAEGVYDGDQYCTDLTNESTSADGNKTSQQENFFDSSSIKRLVEYGQTLLSVYRLVKRGIIPDPLIINYLMNNLSPSNARKLASKYMDNSRICSDGTEIEKKISSRADLAYNVIIDPEKYNSFAHLPSEQHNDVMFAIRTRQFAKLQAAIYKKYVNKSLKTAEQIYDYVINSANSVPLFYPIDVARSRNDSRISFISKLNYLIRTEPLPTHLLSSIIVNQNHKKFDYTNTLSTLLLTVNRFRRHNFDYKMLKCACLSRIKDEIVYINRKNLEVRQQKRQLSIDIAKLISFKLYSMEHKKQVEAEKQRVARLKALRENDMESYLQMIKNVKNQRILEILNNTEKLLQNIGAKVLVEINDNIEKEKIQNVKKLTKSNKNQEEVIEKGKSNTETIDEQRFEITNEECNATVITDNTKEYEKQNQSIKSFSLTHMSQEKVQQPSLLVGGELIPYQLAGLEFLVNLYNNNLSGILADEMGLGKTIQTISLLAYLKEYKKNNGPHLVAVPLSTLPNWAKEFQKWCPSLRILSYRGTKEERRVLNAEIHRGKFNVLLTTFEYILREKKCLSRISWKLIIIDEGHKMKNSKSKFHSTLGEFRSTNRLLLTGTPLQNNLNELWSLLNFLMPKTFNSGDDFEKWFEEPFKEHYENKEDVIMTEEEKMVIINRLHLVLRPFLLRRIKSDVLGSLPTKTEYIIRICLSSYQEFLYDRLVNKCLKVRDTSGKITSKNVSNGLMQLRKAVNHPYLFSDKYLIDENMYRTSGKVETLDRMITKLIRFNHKVLIFSQMTSLMDILSDYLSFKQIKFYRLDGSMSINERQEKMEEFNLETNDTFIFMLSTRAGGLGLNLQSADTVILFDSDWNPHVDLQAQARAHRVGQTKEVRVYRFVTLSPVEELILNKAEYKLNMDEQIIQAGMFSSKFNEEEREEKLRSLLSQKNCCNLSRATTPLELCRMLARTPEEEEEFIKMEKEIFKDKLYINDDEDTYLNQSMHTSNSKSYAQTEQTEEYTMNSTIYNSTTDDNIKSNKVLAQQITNDNEKIRQLLVDCGRLIRYDEIPKNVITANMDEEDKILNTDMPRQSRLNAQKVLKTLRFNDSSDAAESDERRYRSISKHRLKTSISSVGIVKKRKTE